MDFDQEPGNRDSDGRGGSGTGNFIWYVIAIGLATLFLAAYLFRESGEIVSFTDMIALVEQSRHDSTGKLAEGATGWHDVQQSKKTIRVRDLKQVEIGKHVVHATVSMQVISVDGSPVDQGGTKYKLREEQKISVYIRDSDQSESRITSVLNQNNIPYSYKSGPTFWTAHWPLLLLTALLIGLFFFMMRRLGGAGSPMAFGRSRGRMYAQEDLGVMFDDVAGIDEAVEEVREVVDFLQSPEKYQRLGGRIPKGVMLVGPPGTGKTLLAKAIAGEAGVPFFGLSGSDFVEMFVGVGAARVRDMFRQAEAKAPCIIFIDELDALGKTRGTSVVGGHDEREQTLNALLVEMDGFDSNVGVIVMAATNRPEMLDPALLRPGRFDRNVLVDRPDVAGREAILKVHVRQVKLDPAVDLKQVASISSGFAGADLANLVNEAALLAAREDKSAVTFEEFNEAVERVTAGLEKKQRVMNEDEKQRVAYHESGHALVAYSLPNTDPVHKVSIIPRGMAALGYTMQRPEGDRFLMTQPELESRIHILLAGTMAEELVFDDISTGAQNDLERATEIARRMVMDYGMSRLGRVNYHETSGSAFLPDASAERMRSHSEQTAREIDEEVQRLINQSIEVVRELLAARREALVALAKRLIEVESVDSVELQEIVDASTSGPWIVPGTTDVTKRPAPGARRDESVDGNRLDGSGGGL